MTDVMEKLINNLSKLFAVRKLVGLREIKSFFPLKIYVLLLSLLIIAVCFRSFEWKRAGHTELLSAFCVVSLGKPPTPAKDTIGSSNLLVKNLVDHLPTGFASEQTNDAIILKNFGNSYDDTCPQLIEVRDKFVNRFNTKIQEFIKEKTYEEYLLNNFFISYFELTGSLKHSLTELKNSAQVVKSEKTNSDDFLANWEKIDAIFPRESHSITEIFVRFLDHRKFLLTKQTFFLRGTDTSPTFTGTPQLGSVFSVRRLLLIFLAFLTASIVCLVMALISALKVNEAE